MRQHPRSSSSRQLLEIPLLFRVPRSDFRVGNGAHHEQRIVQLVGARDLRPRLLLHPINRRLIELAQLLGGLHVKAAPCDHGLSAALLERRVVEEGVGLGIDHLVGERRRLRRVARHERELSRRHPLEHALQTREVHRFQQTVRDGLLHQRMVGNLPVPHEVLGARELVGEHGGHQVLRVHALERRGHLLPASRAQHGERPRRVPAPARAEHRRVQHRLHQQVLRRLGLQILEHVLEREAVLGPERQDDRVLGGRGLELEVEAAAEPLAERESPRAVHPTPERRVQHQLHPPRLVEEALQHERLLGRGDPEDPLRGLEILDHLPGRGLGDARDLAREPRSRLADVT